VASSEWQVVLEGGAATLLENFGCLTKKRCGQQKGLVKLVSVGQLLAFVRREANGNGVGRRTTSRPFAV
jgi:hypothetical protein